MKKIIILIILILTILTLYSREFVFLQELEHGTVNNERKNGPLIHDFDRDGNDELIMWTFFGDGPDTSNLYFYEYEYDYNLTLVQNNKYNGWMWTAGIGDCDGDGLYEILGGDPDSDFIYLMEQSDSFDYPDSITWRSPETFTSFYPLTISNKLKPDSKDRIVGDGIPGISTTTYGLGFYYYECAGNDSYYINTFMDATRISSSGFTVGDIDKDGLGEYYMELKIPDNPVYIYEAYDSTADSFNFISQTPGVLDNMLVIEDTDGDSINELLKARVLSSGGGISYYQFDMYEDENGDDILDSIWTTEFSVYTNNDVIFGCDIDYGDMDGDGNYEIAICGGRHFEVWKASGNNSYYKIFEWTNPDFTTTQSHIRCHDFNKNGIDEVIYSGSGTYVGDEATFIFECRPLAKLNYNNPYDLGDKPIGVSVTDSLYLRAIDELPVVIDSLKLLKHRNITLNEPTYPCSIPAYDSLPILFDIYSDTSTFITDTLIVYSNDWYGNIDTIEVNAGIGARIVIDSAVASDNRNTQSGVDYDDYVRLYFNYPIDPPDTSILNLDSILPLSNNHTWYDGTGNIKQINYTRNNTVMTIWLSTNTSIPTVLVGDSIYPDTASITDKHYYSYLKDPVMITGSFGPTGIDNEAINSQPLTIDCQLSTINITSDKNTNLIIYNITGRIIDNITVKEGLNTYTPKQSGIYFIINKNKNIIKKAIIVK